jgi:hypothetical protein
MPSDRGLEGGLDQPILWRVHASASCTSIRNIVRNCTIKWSSGGSASKTKIDVRGWYVSGTYRILKRLAVGSYYSRYCDHQRFNGGRQYLAFFPPNQTDTSLPANHIYDKVITRRGSTSTSSGM